MPTPSFTTQLPAHYYLSDEQYERDLDLIYGRSWLVGAHASEIARPGDAKLTTVGDASIVLVRGEDGVARGFHNFCRHRGATLCEASGPVGRRLTCSYHAWSYDLEGRLRGAPNRPPELALDDWGLKAVTTVEWCGIVWINLDPSSTTDDLFAAVAPARGLEQAGLDRTKVIDTVVIESPVNWKLVMDNNIECYHCRPCHPEFCAVFDERTYEVPDIDPTATVQFAPTFELRPGVESFSLDGRRVCDIPLPVENGGCGLDLWPGTQVAVHADYAIVNSVQPLAPMWTKSTYRFLVHEDAVEGRDYEVDRVTALWKRIIEQDAVIIAMQSTGVRSPAFEPGPLHPEEEVLAVALQHWYLDRVGRP
jgi:Rieske 2Fe-2S family protein